MKPALFRYAFLVVTAFGSYAVTAFADTVSYTGDLRTSANVISCGTGCTLGAGNSDSDYAQYAAVVESFAIGATSTLEAITFSYGGGVNAAGTNVASGGFAPYLSLFDSAGDFIASTYFGTTCPAGAKTSASSGACYDVALDGGTLAAGTYKIAISSYLNQSFAENLGSGNLSDGFTGLGNLNSGEDLHYAFDLTVTPSGTTPPPPPSPVPEPAPLALVGTAAFVVFAYKQRRSLLAMSKVRE